MEWVLLLIAGILYVKLVLVQAIRSAQATMSAFERRRRIETDDETAREEQYWLDVQPQVRGLFRFVSVLLLIFMVGLLQAALGWLMGLAVGAVLLLLTYPLVRLRLVRFLARRSFELLEPYLKKTVDQRHVARVLQWFRGEETPHDSFNIASREEFAHVLQQTHVIPVATKRMLQQVMTFPDIHVETALTPRHDMVTIERSEVLGPKRLDELHKTGQEYFLLVDKKDTALGVLAAHSIMNTLRQGALTAEEMVEPAFQVKETALLSDTLDDFLREKRHFGIVVNKSKEITGVITIEAIIAQLLGTPPSHGGE